jgi:hypothetical protein
MNFDINKAYEIYSKKDSPDIKSRRMSKRNSVE